MSSKFEKAMKQISTAPDGTMALGGHTAVYEQGQWFIRDENGNDQWAGAGMDERTLRGVREELARADRASTREQHYGSEDENKYNRHFTL